jgi:MoxR-like ATPase
MQPFDAREAGRVVGSVLLASAPLTAELVERANRGLVRLQLPPLGPHDGTPSTPEELAPLIPLHLRDAIADLILELAGSDALRSRVARSYLALWNFRSREVPEGAHRAEGGGGPGERIARALIGQLPKHQRAGALTDRDQEDIALNEAVYRGRGYGNVRAPAAQAPAIDPLRARVERVRAEMCAVIAAVDRVVIGKHDVVTRVVTAMAARGHVLLVDAPGVGKTLLCKTIAAALGARFGRIQLTPDLMPLDVTGGTIYDAHAAKFVFRPGPVFTNLLLADEINRATPKTQSALLEVMEERTVTVDGTTHRMADPFQVLATMNPLDHDGTFPLPAAQIDRFMVMLELGYPSIDDEVRVLDTHLAASHGETLPAPVIAVESFVEWQRTVPMIHASPEVKRAAVAYVDELRKTAPQGAAISPRATLAWMRAAQARAILAGREFVTTDDLLDVAPEILRHRLWVSAPEVRDRLRAIVTRGQRQ